MIMQHDSYESKIYYDERFGGIRYKVDMDVLCISALSANPSVNQGCNNCAQQDYISCYEYCADGTRTKLRIIKLPVPVL